MTSFGHSKPCQKTMYIYASLSLIIKIIKLMSVNYAYNNKKNLTWIFMKGAGCYSEPPRFSADASRWHLHAFAMASLFLPFFPLFATNFITFCLHSRLLQV